MVCLNLNFKIKIYFLNERNRDVIFLKLNLSKEGIVYKHTLACEGSVMSDKMREHFGRTPKYAFTACHVFNCYSVLYLLVLMCQFIIIHFPSFF